MPNKGVTSGKSIADNGLGLLEFQLCVTLAASGIGLFRD